MKLNDIIDAAVEKTPSLEVDIETTDGREYPAVFRNFLLLSDEERQTFREVGEAPAAAVKPKAGTRAKAAPKAPEGDQIAREVSAAKAALGIVLRPIEGTDVIADLEAVFSANPEKRGVSWIALFGEWIKETQLGEAKPSQ